MSQLHVALKSSEYSETAANGKPMHDGVINAEVVGPFLTPGEVPQ